MKLLLVDDEIPTLEFLEHILDSDGMGITITGKAMDGEKALLEIRDECPDILITDIKMPNMDGLELVKKIRETNSSMKIIILSAYGEFEYAQSAIKYDVAGYILKPVDEEKLKDLLVRVIGQLRDRRVRDENHTVGKLFTKEKIFRQLMYKRNDIPELLEKIKKLELDLNFDSFQLLNIRIDTLSYMGYAVGVN